MNELLGWYGLPSVENMDTGSIQAMTSLTSHNSQRNVTSPRSPSQHTNGEDVPDDTERPRGNSSDYRKDKNIFLTKTKSKNNDEGLTEDTETKAGFEKENGSISAPMTSLETNALHSNIMEFKTANDSNNNDSNSGSVKDDTIGCNAVPSEGMTCSIGNTNCDDIGLLVGPKSDDEQDQCAHNHDHDGEEDEEKYVAHHSRDSFSAGSDSSYSSNTAFEVPESERSVVITCSWCQKRGYKLLTLETPAGIKVFCSEPCFTQCRRASFKKKKVCDWCKHVRHTVNFVDFQDGDTQLQFCSEKCLNQYKMNIFCKEAQEHLQHFQDLEDGMTKTTSRGNKNGERIQKEILITPELWLARNDPGGKVHGHSFQDLKQETDGGNPEQNENRKHRKARKSTFVRGENESSSLGCNLEEDEDPKIDGYEDDGDDENDEDFEENGNENDDDLEDGFNDSEPGEVTTFLRQHRDKRLEDNIASSDDETTSFGENCLRAKTSQSEYSKLKRSKSGNIKQKRENNGCQRFLIDRDSFHSTRFLSDHRRNIAREQKSRISPGHGISTDESNTDSLNSKATDILLQQWAATRLLNLMPQHMRNDVTGLASAAGVSGIGQPLSSLPYPANSLLYSNLFRLPMPQVSPSTSTQPSATMTNGEHIGLGNTHHLKSRHESRRELLRDRDLFHAADKKTKSVHEKDKPDTSLPVPLSPSSASHSSGSTPGDSHLSESNPLPAHLSGFRTSLPHSLLMANNPLTGATPELFSDPSHASALFQLHLALQNSTGRQNNMFSSNFRAPPPSLNNLPKEKPGDIGQRVSETSAPNRPTLTPSSSSSAPNQHQHHSSQNSTGSAGMSNPSTLFQFSQGVPPVTVLVPHPVPIPIPIPIPFPIPLGPEKFKAFLDKNSELNTPSTSRVQAQRKNSNPDATVSTPSGSDAGSTPGLAHTFIKRSPASSPSPFNAFSPNLELPGGSTSPSRLPGRSEDSFMLQSHDAVNLPIQSPSSSTSMKRSLTETILPYMFDLSKKPRHSVSSSSNDEEAMDLSKQSTSGSLKNGGDVTGKENNATVSRYTLSSAGNPSPENLVVPKIHIVSDKSAPPLCTPPMTSHLPLPLEQSTYSSRRSRILDAPSVPKVTRMPSPERRYVRNVPKDMVEAAKRRGLRARIKN